MANLGESLSVQRALIEKVLVPAGWTYVPGKDLARAEEQVFVEPDLVAALTRLNPAIAADPALVDEVMFKLRAVPLAAGDEGLVESNRRFRDWLHGVVEHEFTGTHGSVPVRLIDHSDPAANTLVVSDEVTLISGGHKRRLDLVLWVNGIPLVVGETKTPFSTSVSWRNGAHDLVEVYQAERPDFFVPNVFCFATEGKELAHGTVGTPAHIWQLWGPQQAQPALSDVLTAAKQLLDPRAVLDILAGFTVYETPKDDDPAPDGAAVSLRKLMARYPQFEAVRLICDRARDPHRNRGLVYHSQGSGKTLAMVFAAGQLLADPALNNPTVVLIADRVQLVRQLWDQFRTTSMPRLKVPPSTGALQKLLADDTRGLIFTTIHKFAGAPPALNTRSNIVVMVDEAHRTQDGDLGLTMRAALPNATLFGFTGTPIAELDRNTFDTFGDPADTDKALHTYSSDQSIADGMTVPIHVSPRKVEFNLDQQALDEAFKELAEQEGLTDEQRELVTTKVSKVGTFFTNPERIRKVCADILDHFYATVDPLGMKAQIVVFDRAACVAYHQELSRLLAERRPEDKAAVVMHVTGGKDEDGDWADYRLSEAAEEQLLKRFRTYGDPLKFLICTSKLGTGFDAPIEGVMYLDKPLKNHTLYQTITRTNRNWRNPVTGQDKRYGIVVDYVGLGGGFARAMAPANPEQATRQIDVDSLVDAFEDQLAQTLWGFSGLDRVDVTVDTLTEAQARLKDPSNREVFVTHFGMLAGIWEACAPHERLAKHRDDYRFLAKVYASISPSGGAEAVLWERLGAKTIDLVHSKMTDIRVTKALDVIVADADTIQRLQDEGLIAGPHEVTNKTPDQIIDSISERLKAALAKAKANGQDPNHPVLVSLGARLEELRKATIQRATDSITWLQEAFTLARDVTQAEKAIDEDGVAGLDLLPDPNVGALTQIFREYAPADAPEMVEDVVTEIDAIVKQVRYDGWAVHSKGDRVVRQAIRTVLKKYELHRVEGLFDRAYAYIAEHY